MQNSKLPSFEEMVVCRLSRDATGKCDACTEETDKLWNKTDYFLVINFSETWFALCPKHEADLLNWLIANRIKRMSKGKKVFPVSKTMTLELLNLGDGEEEWVIQEDAENTPSVLERLTGGER